MVQQYIIYTVLSIKNSYSYSLTELCEIVIKVHDVENLPIIPIDSLAKASHSSGMKTNK